MKFLILVLYLTQLPHIHAQEDPFDAYNFDKKHLEHLVKTGVDKVRKEHGCNVLVNDSILYIASDHHAQYMSKNKRLTHNENDAPETKKNHNSERNILEQKTTASAKMCCTSLSIPK